MSDGLSDPGLTSSLPDDEAPRVSGQFGHATILVGSLVVLCLACLFEVRDDQRVECYGFVLPESCVARSAFNIDCPACGLTRSFVHLAHGNVSGSVRSNRVGWAIMLFVVFQIPLRTAAITNRIRWLHPSLEWQTLSALGLASLLIANRALDFIGW